MCAPTPSTCSSRPPTAGDGGEPPHTSGVDALRDGRRLFQAYVFFFEKLVDVGAP
ncbi:hypothetical protein ACWCQW_16935 [Streptomyces mirabilis]